MMNHNKRQTSCVMYFDLLQSVVILLNNTLDEIFNVPYNEDCVQQQPPNKTELNRYVEDQTRINNNMNILPYWKLNRSIYPNLARITKRILAILAINTTIERLFSDSSNTITDRRAHLDIDKSDHFLFIKRNMRILKEIYPSIVQVCNK